MHWNFDESGRVSENGCVTCSPHVILRLDLSGNKGLPYQLSRDSWGPNVADHLANLAKYGAVISAHFGALWTMRTIGDVWPDLSEIVCERLFSANLDEWAKEKL